ncbi:MAG: hypothetical protein M1391_14560 [Bacteroidetes bacterium]|nr:hypothetical protein [Bacteroidota bacterium]
MTIKQETSFHPISLTLQTKDELKSFKRIISKSVAVLNKKEDGIQPIQLAVSIEQILFDIEIEGN